MNLKLAGVSAEKARLFLFVSKKDLYRKMLVNLTKAVDIFFNSGW